MPHTPLGRVFTWHGTDSVTQALITKTLRDAVHLIGKDLGFLPGEVLSRSLRAASAMALLVSKVDTDIICLLGRWRSDEMLQYLHLSAKPLMKNFAARMLHAEYNMTPSQLVPMQ